MKFFLKTSIYGLRHRLLTEPKHNAEPKHNVKDRLLQKEYSTVN